MKTINYLSWDSYGTVVVKINHVIYTYTVDAAMIPEWQRTAVHKPWKVFNEIKRTGSLQKREEREDKMAKAMHRIQLVKSYEKVGYKADTKKCMCPDCYAVNVNRAGKNKKRSVDMDLMKKASRKVFLFHKDGSPSVAACPCGFRKTSDGKIQHSQQFIEEFGEKKAEVKPASNTAICTAKKADGSPCTFKALPGSDRCGVHKKRLF